MRVQRLLTALGVTLGTTAVPAQSVQYTSPAGVAYRSQPDTDAITRAQAALAADPRNAQRFIDLGMAQSGARQFREAIETFTRGLAVAPNHAMLYRWRGHRYLSVREFDKAEADLRKALTIDSTNYGALYHLGIIRFIRSDFTGAAELFRRALPHAPDPGENAGSTDWRWMSLMRAGKKAEARAWLDSRPDSMKVNNAYTQRIRMYRGETRPEQLITPADTQDVAIATLHYGLGNYYLVQGDTAKALELFQAAAQTAGWPGFGFIVSEVELRRLRRR